MSGENIVPNLTDCPWCGQQGTVKMHCKSALANCSWDTCTYCHSVIDFGKKIGFRVTAAGHERIKF